MKAAALLLVFITGCTLLQPPDAVAPEKRLSAERIQQARRITIEYGTGSLGQGYSERWVLERDGPCTGEVANYASPSSGKVTANEAKYRLPSETFGQARRALLESKFRTLRPGRHGNFFEGSASLTVDCDGIKHGICWGLDEVLRDDPLLTFVRSLTQRARLVSPAKEPADKPSFLHNPVSANWRTMG
jgi:hypothetical protein